MKKIFALLLSIWIPIYLMFGLLASCEKSTGDEVSLMNSLQTDFAKNSVVGKWQLKEFFQNSGNGGGAWMPAQNAEQVIFSESGDFSANEFFPDKQFNKYRIIDSTKIELYSTQSEEKATYYFKRESATNLLFQPPCRENCSKRYVLK
jgi:hypothetical protein